jgi:hypothetical protein
MCVTERERSGTPRGFVLLIVLMVLIALSTAVILSFETAAFESTTSLRERDQALARSLAEGCLDRALKHARSVIAGTGGSPDPDLDRILDPNLNTSSADDYIPTSNDGVVYVPNNGTDPLRRFAVFRDQGGTHSELNGGGCLVRFDDNMDDQLPGLTATTAANITEGPGAGAQVLNRDRDGVVTVTAIGLYPVFAATADADIYERAHGRSTLKGLVNVEVSFASAVPTVHVWDNIAVADGASHNAVCGAGGALYDDLYNMTPSQGDRFGVCGEIDDDAQMPNSTPGLPDSHMCPSSLVGAAACEPQVVTANTNSNPTITVDSVNTPTRRTSAAAPSWPYYEGLGRAGGADYRQDDPFGVNLGNYPGAGEACAFYYTQPSYGSPASPFARVFTWDRTATDAGATLTLAANRVNSVTGSNTNENCQTTIAKRTPCSWTWDLANTRWDVSCTATQSPCWKLVAELGGTAEGYLHDVTGTAGPRESTNLVSGVETFQPIADRAIPFIDPASAADWNALCQLGGPAGTQTGGPGDRGFGYNTNRFELMQDLLQNTWPGNKAIHIFDNGTSVTNMVRVPKKFGDEGSPPIQHAIITRGSIEFTEMVYACCPRCDCSSFSPSTWDSATGLELLDTGYFLFSGRYAFFDSDDKVKGIRGDIYAKNIHIDKKVKINGDLFGWGTCTVLSSFFNLDCSGELKPAGTYGGMEQCDSPGTSEGLFETFSDGVSICMRDGNIIVGSVVGFGDVSIHNGNTLINRESHGSVTGPPVIMDWGAIIGWDIWLKEDNNVIGRIISRDDFAMKKHNRIFWPGASTGTSTPTITNVELRVSEQSW